ncbi:hypothetical protein RS130_16030 [Paraglaciecola aquimarina]|uniref:Uncharacterized protein n=1 Tax=Paraglaciecola aquimarina TaxID=1235557 RepID=A0ABU3SYY8_9ALTE|nr:hypothetical protein [Paraglaciecola aquimarina]MDU0355206.1 hypothetical protein [Paraglaciecola aquimarina]
MYTACYRLVFSELGIKSELAINEEWYLIPYIGAAFDYGYTSGQQSGFNNLRLGAELAVSVSADMAISALFEQSLGGSSIKDEPQNKADISYVWYLLHNDILVLNYLLTLVTQLTV